MCHFCTPNIGLVFENKQVSKQFSYMQKARRSFWIRIIFKHRESLAKLMATVLYNIRIGICVYEYDSYVAYIDQVRILHSKLILVLSN